MYSAEIMHNCRHQHTDWEIVHPCYIIAAMSRSSINLHIGCLLLLSILINSKCVSPKRCMEIRCKKLDQGKDVLNKNGKINWLICCSNQIIASNGSCNIGRISQRLLITKNETWNSSIFDGIYLEIRMFRSKHKTIEKLPLIRTSRVLLNLNSDRLLMLLLPKRINYDVLSKNGREKRSFGKSYAVFVASNDSTDSFFKTRADTSSEVTGNLCCKEIKNGFFNCSLWNFKILQSKRSIVSQNVKVKWIISCFFITCFLILSLLLCICKIKGYSSPVSFCSIQNV